MRSTTTGRFARGHANDEGNGDLKRAAITLLATLALTPTANGARYGPMPHHWHAHGWWLAQAICIHGKEGAWNSETGNGYSGGMQFTSYTWASVGGRGRASEWKPREQLYRAWLVYLRDGRSWREWGTAGACGLR